MGTEGALEVWGRRARRGKGLQLRLYDIWLVCTRHIYIRIYQSLHVALLQSGRTLQKALLPTVR